MKKMKILSVFMLTFMICQSPFAQAFLKAYSDPTNPNASVSFECITEKMDPQDNFYIGGHIGDTITLFKINTLGTVLGTYKIKPSPANTRLDAIMIDNNGLVVVLGNIQGTSGGQGFIFQYDPGPGVVNWFSQTAAIDAITYLDMSETNGRYYLVSGEVRTPGYYSGLIMQINRNGGGTSPGTEFLAGGLETPLAMQLSGSTIYTAGRYALGGGANGFRASLSRFNSATFAHNGSNYYLTPAPPVGGARTYSNDILIDGNRAVMVGNGDDNAATYAFENLHITKVKTSDGSIDWSRKYDVSGLVLAGALSQIRLDNFRHYAVMGFAVNQSTQALEKARLWSVDPANGDVLWNRQYNLYRRTTNTGSSYEYGFTVAGSYTYAVGQNSTTGITKGVFLKVNSSNGNVVNIDGTSCYDTVRIKKSKYTFVDSVHLTFLNPPYQNKNKKEKAYTTTINDSLVCGSSTSPCHCFFGLLVDGGAIGNTHPNCGDTIRTMQCGLDYYFTPTLDCDLASINNAIMGISIKDPNGNPVNWPGNFNGTGALAIPSGVSGIYSLTYYWGSNGTVCDSCTYYMDITCCGTCTPTVHIFRKPIFNAYLNCNDTASLSCGTYYNVAPALDCGSDSVTTIIGAAIKDPSGNIPSWALPFITSGGTGPLSIPAGISSGIYTLTYYWGLNGVACDSCKIYLKITCCTNFTGTAGPDVLLYGCCGGVPLSASASGGIAPYTYLWSPAAGLSNPNIQNPICTMVGTYTVTIKDAYGCTVTDQVVASAGSGSGSCCRSTDEHAKSTTTITVSPNPTTNSFKITGLKNKIASLDIANSQGIRVAHYNNVIDGNSFGASLPKGIYMLRFNFKDGTSQSVQLIKN